MISVQTAGHPASSIPPRPPFFIPHYIKPPQTPECRNLYWYLSVPAAALGPPWLAPERRFQGNSPPFYSYDLIRREQAHDILR